MFYKCGKKKPLVKGLKKIILNGKTCNKGSYLLCLIRVIIEYRVFFYYKKMWFQGWSKSYSLWLNRMIIQYRVIFEEDVVPNGRFKFRIIMLKCLMLLKLTWDLVFLFNTQIVQEVWKEKKMWRTCFEINHRVYLDTFCTNLIIECISMFVTNKR